MIVNSKRRFQHNRMKGWNNWKRKNNNWWASIHGIFNSFDTAHFVRVRCPLPDHRCHHRHRKGDESAFGPAHLAILFRSSNPCSSERFQMDQHSSAAGWQLRPSLRPFTKKCSLKYLSRILYNYNWIYMRQWGPNWWTTESMPELASKQVFK